MQVISKFKADDGTEFTTEADCIKHEALCAEIAEILGTLPARPDSCDFANGSGYIQHVEAPFMAARTALLRIGQRLFSHRWFDEALADPAIHPSWCGRLIGEIGGPLNSAWYRFACTEGLREWGQPYYASHPGEATQTRLNP